MKNVFKLFILSLIIFVLAPSVSFAQTDAVVQKEQHNVVRDKVWKITLNHAVDPTTITKNNIVVLDAAGNKVNISLVHSAEDGIIKVNPPADHYKAFMTYTLVLTDNVKNVKGKPLKASTMKFTTNNQFSKAEVFIENEENIVELKDGIKIVESLGEMLLSFNENAVTVLNPSEELANAKKGDILALPPTEDYPFGFAVKVLNKVLNGNELTLRVEQPKLEDVIDGVDIAATIPMSSLMNLQDVEDEHIVASTNPIAVDKQKVIDFLPIYSDLDEKDIEGFKVVLNNYEFIDKAVMSGEMGFTGNISAQKNDKQTKFILDMKVLTESRLALNYLQVPKGVKKRYPLVKDGLQFRIAQTAGLVGISIEPALVLEVKGHIGTHVDVKTESKLSVSATVPEGKGGVIGDVDIPATDASMSISSVNADGSATASLELPFMLQVLQFNMATLGVESGVKAEFKGYLEGSVKFGNIESAIPSISDSLAYCLDSSVTFFANPYFSLGRAADDKNTKYTFFKTEKDLFALSACSLDRLAIEKNIDVDGYSKIDFPITGIELEGNKKPLDLYDDKISLQTNDKLIKANRIKSEVFKFLNHSFDYELTNVAVGEQVKTKVLYKDVLSDSPIEQDVTLTARGNIRGQVVNEINKAVPNATVGLYKQVTLKDQVLVEEIKTDSKGRFELMAPDGLYVLKV
ncbi:MAG: carboxypeptidase-like regulatory domain-containing protein, partial [Lysinibacillus sp.]